MDLIVTETLGAASGGTIMSGVGAMYEVRALLPPSIAEGGRCDCFQCSDVFQMRF
jgi:hypothetical protein